MTSVGCNDESNLTKESLCFFFFKNEVVQKEHKGNLPKNNSLVKDLMALINAKSVMS